MIGAITPIKGSIAEICARAAMILSFWLGTVCCSMVICPPLYGYLAKLYTFTNQKTRLSARRVRYFTEALELTILEDRSNILSRLRLRARAAPAQNADMCAGHFHWWARRD